MLRFIINPTVDGHHYKSFRFHTYVTSNIIKQNTCKRLIQITKIRGDSNIRLGNNFSFKHGHYLTPASLI